MIATLAELAIAADHLQQILGLQSLAEARGVHQIDEHDRQRAPFGACRLGRRGLLSWATARRREQGDGATEPLAVADRQTEFAQVVVGQLGDLVQGDTLVAKRRMMLTEPDRPQPLLHTAPLRMVCFGLDSQY